MKKYTSYRAMRGYCLRCKNNSYISVKVCPEYNCSLYMYRLGKRPDPAELQIWQRIYRIKLRDNRPPKSNQRKQKYMIKNRRIP